MDQIINNSESEIVEFYRGQTLFITGSTGFMGKVLVEKLLRTCTDLDTVFLLLRSKKNEHILGRADKLLADPVFANIEKSQLAKVVPISGDISLPGLGLSAQDRQILIDRVTTVFHSAATVRFTDPVRPTMQTNLRGTSEMLKLCKEIRYLRALVYVSTAYTHCTRPEIDETTYPMPVTPEFVINCVENMNDEQMEVIAPTMMGAWPNNYAFSKALAESLVSRGCGDVPVVIFRPSIVMSCAKEPLPGWNDNLNGPSGMVLGCSMGIIRATHCDITKKVDFVPADMAINAMIAAAWYANTNGITNKPTILNYTSGSRNPLTWREYQHTLTRVGVETPPSAALWYHGVFVTKSALLYRFVAFFVHFLPALLLDTIALITRKKMRMVRLNRRIELQFKVLAYFATHEWTFSDKNVQAVISRMSPYDRKMFPCDVAELKWDEYLRTYIRGIRKYLLKDDDSTIPAALKRYQRLYYMHRGLQCALVFLGVVLVSRLASFV